MLGIHDRVASAPKSAAELAATTGIDGSRLSRLLRAMVAVGLLVQMADGSFGNTEVGAMFREGVPGSRRNLVRMLVPESYRNWEHFMETLRTGVTGQQLAHGATLWELIARDPDFGARFNDAMAGNSEQMAMFVATATDFGGARVVVDVGGGEGSLLAGVLRAHPELRGIVFDVAGGLAQTASYLELQGVAARCEIVEGDFFKSVPEADVYLLKDILHDWDDERATAILRVCRRAMKPASRLLIVERLVPSRIGHVPEHLHATITDLQMMVQLGGKERTVEEFDVLFAATGLKAGTLTPGGVYQLLEALPVVS